MFAGNDFQISSRPFLYSTTTTTTNNNYYYYRTHDCLAIHNF